MRNDNGWTLWGGFYEIFDPKEEWKKHLIFCFIGRVVLNEIHLLIKWAHSANFGRRKHWMKNSVFF